MVICYLLGASFRTTEIENVSDIVPVLEGGRRELASLELDDIISLLAHLGKELVGDKELNTQEGASFISLWLRRDNLERLCALDYGDVAMIDRFVEVRPGLEMRAQPRGITCHWLPNNVPSLAFFSLMLSVLSKNASVLKVSDVNRPILEAALRRLSEISIQRDGRKISGSTIVGSVCMLSFSSADRAVNNAVSEIADVKIAWGSGEAVNAVIALPQKDTCEIVVFGPKYSFAVMDQEYLDRKGIADVLRRLAIDLSLFNQAACSSPQAVFLEKGKISAAMFAEMLAKGLEDLPLRLRSMPKPESMCMDIINARGQYLLSEDKGILMPNDLSWTLLIDHSPGLPEPVQGRCMFIKEVDDLDQVLPWITKKVQTLALCIEDREKRTRFADEASYMGVDRFVEPGEMNDFTLPWDGIMPLSRMIRWTTVRRKDDAQG